MQAALSDAMSICSVIAAIASVVVTYATHYRDGLPCIVLYLQQDRDHGTIDAALANLGKGVARNVRIEGLDRSFVQNDCYDAIKESFLFRTTSCISPGVELRTIIAGVNHDLRSDAGKICEVTVRYEEAGFFRSVHEASRPFTLAYSDVLGYLHMKSDLHEMKDSIAIIASAQEKIADNMMH